MGKLLVYLDIIIPAIVLLAALFYLVVYKTKSIWIDHVLLLFILLQLCLNTLANYLQDLRINNHWVYWVNSVATQLVFTYYFYNLFTDRRKQLMVILYLGLYMAFFVINYLFIQHYSTFNSYTYALGSLFIVLLALTSFFTWIEVIPAYNLNIISTKEFWTSVGILFYFGGSFFIFISYHYLSEVSSKNVGVLWKLHNVFLGIGCFLFLKAISSKKWIPK